jgi:MFS family permease
VNLPVGLAGILLVMRFVPNTPAAGRERFDFPGAFSLFSGLLTFLLALTFGQNQGFGSPGVWVLLGISMSSFVFFTLIETRTSQPMIHLGLFRNKLFSVNLLTAFITFISSAGSVLLMPFFLQNVLQYDPRSAGLLMSVVPISMGLVAPISGSLSDRFGTRRLTVIGLAVLLFGYIAVSTLDQNTRSLGYILRFLPVGLGMGLFQSPNNSAIMGAAPPNRLGVASSLLSLTRTIGQTTGIAVLGALWAGRIHAMLGFGFAGIATSAPDSIQVAALRQTLLAIVVVIASALGLSLWALWKERSVVDTSWRPKAAH